MARALLIGALALSVAAVTAGCEAGLNAPTLEFHEASSGTHDVVNGITISNAFVLGAPVGSSLAPGSSAGVFFSLFNGGSNSDTLVSVSAPGSASSVHVTGGTISLPVQAPVDLSGPQPSVVLTDLTKTLTAGQNVQVTLDFAHAGLVTLTLPVQPQSFYYSTYATPPSTVSPTTTTSPTASPSP